MHITNSTDTKPILFFACGNPSRGDDALGPEFIERIGKELEQSEGCHQIDLLCDFQFQVEHAMDLQGRKQVIFVDANMATTAPIEFNTIVAAKDASYTTHSMTPEAVMDVYQQMYLKPPPKCFLLSIRGHSFTLGDSLTSAAKHNLELALTFIKQHLIQLKII